MNFMPPEWAPHNATWMALARSDRDIWGGNLAKVQEEQLAVAAAIARFEPVVLKVAPRDHHALLGRNLPNITFFVTEKFEDIWVRDSMSPFLVDEYGNVKQRPLSVAEGGAIHVNGDGLCMTTESCLLSWNLGKTKTQIEDDLKKTLGVNEVLWLPGREHEWEPDTNGHIDGICFFANEDTVIFGIDEEMSPKMGENLHKLLHTGLNVVTVLNPRLQFYPDGAPIDHCAEYVNCYMVNGGLIMNKTRDTERDEAAIDIFSRCMPGREIIQVQIDTIATHAGGIHCMTQQEPE